VNRELAVHGDLLPATPWTHERVDWLGAEFPVEIHISMEDNLGFGAFKRMCLVTDNQSATFDINEICVNADEIFRVILNDEGSANCQRIEKWS
jgi:hypothetical protein